VPCVAQPGGPPPPVEIIWFQPNPAAPTWGESGPPVWEYDVIAGSVVELTAPEIRDLDTYTDEGARSAGVPLGTQVEDHTWKYRVVEGGGDIVDPDNWTEYRTDRTFTWWAPVLDGDVTFTFWARDHTPANEHWGTDNAPTSRSGEGNPVEYLTGVIHVHELEVDRMWRGGVDLSQDAHHPSEPDPPHAWDCKLWDDYGLIPSLRYDRYSTAYPRIMAFPGWQQADIDVSLRGKGGWTGTVLPTNLRLFAPWPDEGDPGAITLVSQTVEGITALPAGQALTALTSSMFLGVWIPAKLDRRVTYFAPYTWDWHAEVYGGMHFLTYWQYTSECPVDDAELDWMATLYDAPVAPAVPTPQRVSEVCAALAGPAPPPGTPPGCEDWGTLGVRAAEWADSKLNMNYTYMGEWYDSGTHTWSYMPDVDVWCLMCQGYRPTFNGDGSVYGYATDPADCITGATLAAHASRLVGLPAEPRRLYPRPVRGQPSSWWDPATCWATDPNHPGNPVGYIDGGDWNNFEGSFEFWGLYFTVFPIHGPEDHPADILAHWGNSYACKYWDTVNNRWAWHSNGEAGGHTLVTGP